MRSRSSERQPKYLSVGHALAEADIEWHLQGTVVHGSGLCWPDPLHPGRRLCRALAWDSDNDLNLLLHAAADLDAAGLRPVLVKNPTKQSCGHLWLFLDEDVEPAGAMARAERLAPCLRRVQERFPNDAASNGGRIRLPGGHYLPVKGKPVPVLVAAGRHNAAPIWLDGTTPAPWALIGCAVSQAGILTSTWLPPAERPQLKPATVPTSQKRATVRLPAVQGGLVECIRAWSAANPAENLVRVKHHKFAASWRGESVPSVHLYDDGHWHDYGGDQRHGQDSFDLWCSLNGYWDASTNRPRRVEAARALGLLAKRGGTQ
jgi:hypothetical protein